MRFRGVMIMIAALLGACGGDDGEGQSPPGDPAADTTSQPAADAGPDRDPGAIERECAVAADCGDHAACERGRCLAVAGADAAVGEDWSGVDASRDAGAADGGGATAMDGGRGDAGAGGDGGAGGQTAPGASCHALMVLLDGSGSMGEDFEGVTRWVAVREALAGAGGVFDTMQAQVAFGLTVYRSWVPDLSCLIGLPVAGFPPCEEDDAGVDECPVIGPEIAPALGAYATLEAAYPEREPTGRTPTAQALQHVYDNLTDGTSVLLITDGAPNACDGSETTEEAQAAALAVAGAAAAAGVRTRVVGIGTASDPSAEAFLQQLALAGGTVTAALPAAQVELRAALLSATQAVAAEPCP